MDLPLLAAACWHRLRGAGQGGRRLLEEAMACIAAYRWPGNVRELQNEILRMVALATTPLLGADLLSPRAATPVGETPAEDFAWAAGLAAASRSAWSSSKCMC
jgi:two-component system response regulator HupR/HoxA